MTKSWNSEPASTKPSLYNEVARFTHDYFGTEAPQHIGKLIEIHTHKSPDLLSQAELMSLLDWIRGAAAYLEDDKEKIEHYTADLLRLATTGSDLVNDQSTGGQVSLGLG